MRERLANRGYKVSDDGTELLREIAEDFEGNLEPDSKEDSKDDRIEADTADDPEPVPKRDEHLRAELEVVERFAARATALSHDSKARRLLDALRIIQEAESRDPEQGKRSSLQSR